ncbi:UNVERIFIED_CONTAM: hypothetical protein HDU68_010163 [Siphonaria sp. JEL0065]|nr:hypothetical protein HDU68_010163 [Siphonaria sp. JEL0065]
MDSLHTQHGSIQKAVSDLSTRIDILRDFVEDKIDSVSLQTRGSTFIKQEPGTTQYQQPIQMTKEEHQESALSVDLSHVANTQVLLQNKLVEMQADAQTLFQFVHSEFGDVRREIQGVYADVGKVLEVQENVLVTVTNPVPAVATHTSVSTPAAAAAADSTTVSSKKRRSSSKEIIDVQQDENKQPSSTISSKKSSKKSLPHIKFASSSDNEDLNEPAAETSHSTPGVQSSRPPKRQRTRTSSGNSMEIQNVFDALVYSQRHQNSNQMQPDQKSRQSVTTEYFHGRKSIRMTGWHYELQYGDYLEAYYEKESGWFLARALYYTVTGRSHYNLQVHYVGYGKNSQDCIDLSTLAGRNMIRAYNPNAPPGRLGAIGKVVVSDAAFDAKAEKPFMVPVGCLREGNQFILRK